MGILLPLAIVGAITGVVAIILGGVLGFKVLPDVMEEKLKNNIRLELSQSFRNWETPPFDVTTKIFFFNVKNAAAIQEGKNAIVDEIGPLIYKQTRRKDNIFYNAQSDTFTYDELVSYEYDPSSSLKETEYVTTLNVLKYMSLMYVHDTTLMDQVKDSFIYVFKDTKNEDLFHTIQIEDFLFKGYENGLFADVNSDLNAKILLNEIVSNLNGNPRYKKTADGYKFFAYKPEKSYKENIYEMYGGVKDIYKQGQIKSINSKENINVWPKLNDNYCNSIRGTDSYTFNPDYQVDYGLFVYNNDMCRSLDYAFTREVKVQEFTGHRLILKAENFNYSSENNHNKCFCIEDDAKNKCIPDGFLNLVKCFQGIPLIASQPHFLYTDPDKIDRLDFKPTLERDVSYVDIQTESGTVLRVSRKTQYNIWLKKVTGFAEKIVPFMLPLFWIEETMVISKQSADILNDAYFDDLVIVAAVKWGLLVIGLVLVLGCVGTFVLSKLNLNTKS